MNANESKPLNTYEQRQEARRERYEQKAVSLRQQSDVVYKEAKQMASVIPFGQPILVGHHSEGRDRRYRNRIHNKYGQSFALQEKAEYYDNKADNVGTGGVSSDDPDAIKKLKAQLESMEKNHEHMKAANKAIRINKTPESRIAALMALGFSEAESQQILKPNCFGDLGYAGFELSNNNANMKRVRDRIAQLEKMRQRETVEIACNGYKYREDTEENRVMFIFPSTPSEEIRKMLKREYSFHWSGRLRAWVRKMTNNALYDAERIRERLGIMA